MLAGVAYAASLSIWADRGAVAPAWFCGAGALLVVLAASRRERGPSRALGFGAAVVLATAGSVTPHPGVSAFGALGAMTCALAASIALSRLPDDGGLTRPVRTSARPWAAALLPLWWMALAAPMTPAGREWPWLSGQARAWAVGASAATLVLLFAQNEWTRLRRPLELGVRERALALRALLGTTAAVAVAVVVVFVGRGRGDGMARLVVAGACLLAGACATARDSVRVAQLARRVVTLAIVGGSVALLGALSTEGRADAWVVTIVTAVVTLAIGAAIAWVEGPVRPARGAWLDAFAQAAREATRGDPDDALRAALLALRAPSGAQGPSPELWTFAPSRVTTVDAAGYAQEREGELPEALLLFAAAEPEASLRPEVLDALEVRRPELRPLARWMTARGALVATVVAYEGEPEALLVLPRGSRAEPLALEEVRALKDAADRLAAACRARGTHVRMLERAHQAVQRAEAADERVERLRHEKLIEVGRHALAAARLARPATVGIYSAVSRMALEALERRAAASAPMAVVATSGVDPVPYLARAHLVGARRDAPLVLVDATSAREHDPARWTDPTVSPLALADRGLLVLLDGAALPRDVQQLVARVLAEKRAPWERPEPLDVQLALTAVLPPEELIAQGRLDPGLALRLADAGASPVHLPRLRDRAEDLRAILTDRLAREGLRVQGRPVGIEQAAFARLVDYPFPGEDAELAVVVQRLVATCVGELVRATDVVALRLSSEDEKKRADGPADMRVSTRKRRG